MVVNPDRDLARVARERDWEVRVFRIGVPLRERVSMPPPRIAAALATGAMITAAGAGALWWWSKRSATPPAPPTWSARVRDVAERLTNPAAS